MRKFTFSFVLIISFTVAKSQTFRGTVYDLSTDGTLGYAVVYINGTSVGTYSDMQGNFELNISKYSSRPITISLVGYFSVTISEHSTNKKYLIYLTPKIKELQEVVVTADGYREANLKIFKREFLGNTQNSLDCKILSENNIYFHFNPESKTLKAFSSEPILIHNKALGYMITYYLDKFIYVDSTIEIGPLNKKREQFESMTLLGNYIFSDELSKLSESEKLKIEARRRNAYLGSRMYFFRLLYQGYLYQLGKHNILLSDKGIIHKDFLINSKKKLNSDSLVISKNTLSGYLKNEGDLYVKYRTRHTSIYIKVDSVYFEKDGYFDPVSLEFSGEMSKQRIGDLLPFEYTLE
jgi:hypothetical protein